MNTGHLIVTFVAIYDVNPKDNQLFITLLAAIFADCKSGEYCLILQYPFLPQIQHNLVVPVRHRLDEVSKSCYSLHPIVASSARASPQHGGRQTELQRQHS